MLVKVKSAVRDATARSLHYDPTEATRMGACKFVPTETGTSFTPLQVKWAKPSIAVPKRDTCRLVNDYELVTEQVTESLAVGSQQDAPVTDVLVTLVSVRWTP